VGDTVVIAGGRYHEQVYIKATGAPGKPITFTNQPGERAYLDGLQTTLSNAFIVASKSNLIFDGLYFTGYGNSNRWNAYFFPLGGADFNFYRSKDLTVSRCISAERSFQMTSLSAKYVENLTVDNSVFLDQFNPLYLHDSFNVVVNNSVIARPWIYAMILYVDPAYRASFNRTIFTDNFEMKAEQNISLFYTDTDALVLTDCVFVLRPEHPPEWREIISGTTASQAPETFVNPLFVDPQFAAVEALIAAGVEVSFPGDGLMHEDVDHTFSSFCATNPTVTGLDIGLQPDQFDANGVPD
jgi:hypothetical protein